MSHQHGLGNPNKWTETYSIGALREWVERMAAIELVMTTRLHLGLKVDISESGKE